MAKDSDTDKLMARLHKLRGDVEANDHVMGTRQLPEDSVPETIEHLSRQISALRAELSAKEGELLGTKLRLEELTGQLMENNQALAVLARNLETARVESEKRVAQRIRSLVIPVVMGLQQNSALRKYQVELDIVLSELEDLATGFGHDGGVADVLTSSEMRIASMIRSGLTSREISDHLHISLDTVKTHRRNIRRKLQLNSSNQNLRSFLSAKADFLEDGRR